MTKIPVTSITLLKTISDSADSVRWTEFFRKYEQPMRGFLHERFPTVEPEDAMQETMIALMKALPDYHYAPDEKGHFRNYLMGILRNKARDLLSKRARESLKREELVERRHTPVYDEPFREQAAFEEAAMKQSLMEAALEQLMSDDAISPTNREVFRHVALLHEKPEAVAAQFGLTRNNVDQIKNRLVNRLSSLVASMSSGL